MEERRLLYLYGATDKGRVRPENQDAFRFEKVGEDKAYAVVCDGMGGEGGAWASQHAIEVMKTALERSLRRNVPRGSMQNVMESAVNAANAVIQAEWDRNPAWRGMGTTVVMAVVMEDTVCFGHVGDSRLYWVNSEPPVLQQLTKDHSIVQQWVDMGKITRLEADVHPKRNMITRAIGVEPMVKLDYGEAPFTEGRLLLCSDGLYQYANLPQQLDLIMTCAGEQDVYLLIDEANKAGGNDNITAVILSR